MKITTQEPSAAHSHDKAKHKAAPAFPAFRSGSIALIAASATLLPLLTLLPFAIRSKTNYFAVGSKVLGWTARGAIMSPQTIWIGWNRPSSIATASIVGTGILLLLAVLTVWYVTKRSVSRELKQLSIVHLLVAIAVVAVTAASYTIMRQSSQSQEVSVHNSQIYRLYGLSTVNGSPSCEEINLVSHNGSTETAEPCTKANHVPKRALGYGIAPAYVVLFSALYLVVPLLNWYRYALSSRYVGSIKKNTLFQ